MVNEEVEVKERYKAYGANPHYISSDCKEMISKSKIYEAKRACSTKQPIALSERLEQWYEKVKETIEDDSLIEEGDSLIEEILRKL